MKINIIYSLIFFVCLFSACEQKMEIYHADGNDRLNFYHNESFHIDSLTVYTFIYVPTEQMTDTIWIELETSGFVTDYPRPFVFEQISSGSDAAIAGTHYIAFDDAALKDAYVIPANTNRTRVPVILKKTPDLAEQEVVLRFKVKNNDYFKSGFPGNDIRTIKFSNILTRPVHWDGKAEWYFAGTYGPVKHRFMIDAAAKIGVVVNEDFFAKLVGEPDDYSGHVDMGLTGYWLSFFTTALNEENAARKAEGKDILREAPEGGETVGREVIFKN